MVVNLEHFVVSMAGRKRVDVWDHPTSLGLNPSSSFRWLCCVQRNWQLRCPRKSPYGVFLQGGVLFMNGRDVGVPARYLLVFGQEHLVIVGHPCPYQHDGLVHV